MTELHAPLLALDKLTVQRGEIPLCEGVKLELSAGHICHLIGANGTGKTTLLMQLAGLLPVITGSIYYQGLQTLPIQPLYVSHQLGIHPSLTVAQNLTFLLNLYGITPNVIDIDEALAWVGLQGFETISSSHLSAGQTRRITLARLYLLTPPVTPLWLLDEPFTALDVDMVARMETRLREFTDAGGAIIMTSHQPVGVANQVLDLSDYMV
ncbi:heme ABC exporter ATP-binding protein CcmA [Psychrobacter frigidicola]|uniref:Heme ABC exporter ATP-binding protein CcmA n=1 Tax=Psychrobacter frigidicola TaxID=45611 RepID=A0A5C6ZZU8_9GAMM|nr:heme ABC exporter ATP-binding protein CcmA [Psychrobacter frigidicola]TXD96386.1 heme ABC exporter ATP-binding protein CcmA [Psychrobacter frigidicola]